MVFKSSAARACMRAGISSEKSSSRRSGIGFSFTLPCRGRVGARSAPGWGGRRPRRPTAPARMLQRLVEEQRGRNGRMDGFENAIDVLRDVIVPEAKHAIAFRLKPARSLLIAFRDRPLGVLRAIDLDDQPCRHAGEVGDVAADRYLPTKMRAEHR